MQPQKWHYEHQTITRFERRKKVDMIREVPTVTKDAVYISWQAGIWQDLKNKPLLLAGEEASKDYSKSNKRAQ